VAAAFGRRRKALRYKAGLACGREFTETPAGTTERLNLDLRGGLVRLCVWADGALWFGVSIPGIGRNSGWAFQDAFHGDVRDVSPAALVGMLEATLALSLTEDPVAGRRSLREVWGRVGPA